MPEAMSGFNVQCINDHVAELPANHSLVATCKERAEAGHLSAPVLQMEQCSFCVLDRIEELRKNILHYADYVTDDDADLLDEDRREYARLNELLNDIEPVRYYPAEEMAS